MPLICRTVKSASHFSSLKADHLLTARLRYSGLATRTAESGRSASAQCRTLWPQIRILEPGHSFRSVFASLIPDAKIKSFASMPQAGG